MARHSTYEGRMSDFKKILKRIRKEIEKNRKEYAGTLFENGFSDHSYVYINETHLNCGSNYLDMSKAGIINFSARSCHHHGKTRFKVRISPKFLNASTDYTEQKLLEMAASPNEDNWKLLKSIIDNT